MGLRPKVYGLNAEGIRETRRTNRIVRGMGKGVAPRHKRRREPGGGGSGVTYVAVVSTITGSTWDGSEGTDETITVHPFAGRTISPDRTLDVNVGLGLETPITVTTGKFKKGWVIDGELLGVQCLEWDLPEEFTEEEE